MELVQPQVIKFNNNQSLPEQVRNKYFIYYVISGLFDNTDSIHAIYVNLNSVDKLHDFISDIKETDVSLLFSGNDNFINGIDYFMNEALYNSFINTEPIQEPIILDKYILA